MSVSEVLNDENIVLNINNNTIERLDSYVKVKNEYNFPPEVKQLYEDKIKLLEELLKAKDAEIAYLKK